jgi:hypothetical protein
VRTALVSSAPGSNCSIADEGGFALATTLFALIIIGAIVAGSFATARLELKAGEVSLFTEQAREAAEWGLTDAVANLSASGLGELVIGAPPVDLGAIQPTVGISSSRQVSRLTGALFLVRAQGVRRDAAGRVLSSRWVGSLVRIVSPANLVQIERGWIQLY